MGVGWEGYPHGCSDPCLSLSLSDSSQPWWQAHVQSVLTPYMRNVTASSVSDTDLASWITVSSTSKDGGNKHDVVFTLRLGSTWSALSLLHPFLASET